MKGVCTSVGGSLVLEDGKAYYLFPHGRSNYYVSNFNRETSHMGSFRKELFEIIEKEEIIEKTKEVERSRHSEEISDKYIQMDLFEFIGGEAENTSGIEIVIPKDVLAPFENPAGLTTKKFRKGQLRWRAYVKAVEEYNRCSFFKARELVFAHRKSQEPIKVPYDPEYEKSQDYS